MQKEVDLLKAFVLLKKNKIRILQITSITTLIAVIYCIFATPIFIAKAVINPPKLTDAGAGISFSVAGLGALSGGGGLLSQKTDSDIAISLLETNAIKNIIINKFDLVKYYKQKDIELTRLALKNRVKFTPNIKSGFIEIAVDDTDPKLAMEIANYYTVALGQLISNVAYNRSLQKTNFFDTQLKSAKQGMNVAESNLNLFAKQNGIIAGEQSNVIIGIVTQLQSQLILAQSQLKAMSYYASSDNPDYKALEAQINSYKQQLNQLSNKANANDDIAIPANLAPDLTQKYVGLMREFILKEHMYKILTQQYETNKLDVLSDIEPVAIQVIDPAGLPLHKAKPKRLHILLGGFVFGIFISCLFIIIKNREQVIIRK